MNLIDKVVIKNGVDSDVVKTLNLYTGQVDEINDILATISTSRGVASYNINSGKPQFSFVGVDVNELWIYIDGLGFKCGGITSIDPDKSIKVLPYQSSGVYAIGASDIDKILICDTANNVVEVGLNSLSNGQSLSIQNNSESNVDFIKSIGGSDFFYTIYPNEKVFVKSKGSSTIPVILVEKTKNRNRNLFVNEEDYYYINEITHNDNLPIVMVISGVPTKIVNITAFSTIGREIIFYNQTSTSGIGILPTINLPSGETFIKSSATQITVPNSGSRTIIKVGATIWAYS